MSEMTSGLVEVVRRLEVDMRRYLYDTTPKRRIQCLEKHTERLNAALRAPLPALRAKDTIV